MTVLLVASGLLLGVAALLVVLRMTLGPTILDRAIAFDVLIAISICAIALEAAIDRSSETMPLLLMATLLGFVGSVSVARFSPGSDDVEAEEGDDPDNRARLAQRRERSLREKSLRARRMSR
ncbi:monovalent cation/H+ antiporter complex subunit F [Nocardioides zeae]|uniref:Monovalent cation/H+ antiporter complex subunit F n=1 Tax=Nocardioides imazamoxiresistens TaxID=3231893 RepID=A0ABU3PVT6_9ACTN|nr:monovalent cation/H+ antiporter complex subunit F [Nocardioides zeae]MDT9593338.1 monovalent cation/H+ antiporter complex subunit F [Nocardioides zeae]